MSQQTIYQGSGYLQRLPQLEPLTGRRQLFVVVDPVAAENSGASEILAPLWESHRPTFFSDFRANPQWHDVLSGIQRYQASAADVMIAIGGGTAIDMAKLIRGLAGSDDPWATIQDAAALRSNNVPLIAIPTTAGTGSESTQFAVVYRDGKKHSLDHESLLPQLALIDPALMRNLPRGLTIATGLDAFCQAVESVWAVGADDQSLSLAIAAAELAFRNLSQAANASGDASDDVSSAREAMCRAANWAGQAINRTRTTACHALSYSITSDHGVPHGIAVAMNLLPLLRFNGCVTDDDCVDPRGAAAVRQRIERLFTALQFGDLATACDAISRWLAELDCPRNVTEAGLGSPDSLQRIARSVDPRRLANNPRRLSEEILQQLLQQT